jgi:hypothetical protein
MAKKIIQVEIQNFRNITHEVIDFQDGKSMVITGKNEIGKTNRITAILWLLAGVLFDGTAKDNMSNLVPDNVDYGTTVSVKATFADGQSVEKQYSRPYFKNDNDEWIPKDAVTKFIVNGGKPLTRVSDGYAFINEQLGFTELVNRFNANSLLKGINIAYLMLTTIGIRGLDNATMRALIIDIVGDVSAYDYAVAEKETYGNLIPLLNATRSTNRNGEVQYDINKVRDDLRYSIQDKELGLEVRVQKAKGVIEELEKQANEKVDEIENANALKDLEALNNKITSLEVKKQSLSSGATDKIDLEISQLSNKKLEIERDIREQYQTDLAKSRNTDLELQVRNKEDAYTQAVAKVRNVETELSSEKIKLQSWQNTKTSKLQQVEGITKQVSALKGEYNNLTTAKDDTSKAFVTCPHCNQPFDLSESKEHQAIHKQQVDAQKRAIQEKVATLKGEYDALAMELSDIELNITKQQGKVNEKLNEHTTALTNRLTIEKELMDLRAQLNEQSSKNVPTLNLNTKEVQTIVESIERLRTQKTTVLENLQQAIADVQNEIDELKNQRLPLEVILDKKRVQQANLNALSPKKLEFQKLNDDLTKTKELYALSKELLIATFKELERRVEVNFGKDVYFKLYEPNASDGGATYKTSVCEMYVRDGADRLVPALANGVSTSMQEVRIVEFISRLKSHYGIGDSVILIDRLESLDEDKLALLTKGGNQIITTAVVKNQSGVKYELL